MLSWVALRGRARCCRTRIPAGYVLTETATTLVWVACFSLPSMWLGIPAAIGASLLVLGVSVQVSRFRIGRHSTSATATGPLAQ